MGHLHYAVNTISACLYFVWFLALHSSSSLHNATELPSFELFSRVLDIPLSFDMKAMALMPKQNYSR
jgi:hypothetical protein